MRHFKLEFIIPARDNTESDCNIKLFVFDMTKKDQLHQQTRIFIFAGNEDGWRLLPNGADAIAAMVFNGGQSPFMVMLASALYKVSIGIVMPQIFEQEDIGFMEKHFAGEFSKEGFDQTVSLINEAIEDERLAKAFGESQ
jgi:hypothetical protein